MARMRDLEERGEAFASTQLKDLKHLGAWLDFFMLLMLHRTACSRRVCCSTYVDVAIVETAQERMATSST